MMSSWSAEPSANSPKLTHHHFVHTISQFYRVGKTGRRSDHKSNRVKYRCRDYSALNTDRTREPLVGSRNTLGARNPLNMPFRIIEFIPSPNETCEGSQLHLKSYVFGISKRDYT